ncbi:MAG: hypothetical protein R3F37_21600 [Candidatus Competibacteraceae bacterium]
MVWSITLLAVLAATTLMLGWQRAERFWLKTGLWLALTSSYAFWLWNVPFTWMTPVTLFALVRVAKPCCGWG